MTHLTEGSIKRIMSGERDLNPILQILDIKEINLVSNRFNIVISDGVHYSQNAFLTTALTPTLFEFGRKIKYTIVKVMKYHTSLIKGIEKPIMVPLHLEILKDGSKVEKVIGNPAYYIHEPPHQSADERPAVQLQDQIASDSPAHNPCVTNNSSSETLDKIFPIASISPYNECWPIKVRVTSKTPIKHWKNPQKEGVLFNVELIDKTDGIKATAFEEEVNKFYNVLQEGKLFFISHCRVVVSKYSQAQELIFTYKTEVVPCEEEDLSIPKYRFNFRPLESISQANPGSQLDIIGVCKSTSEVMPLRSKNRELKKRDVILVDPSFTSVTLTLWNKQAEDFVGDSNPVVAVKAGRVTEFLGGKSVCSDSLNINPDISEAFNLKSWFDSLPQDSEFNSISAKIDSGDKIYLLSEAAEAKLGCADTPDYFSAYCTVLYVKTERWSYKACPIPGCLKKVTEQNNGLYKCEKCNKEYDSFTNRLLLSVNVGDFTDHQWITIFHDVAEEFLGVKADDLCQWNEQNNARFRNVFKNIEFHTYLFKFRAKMETFMGESRVKLTAVSVKKLTHKNRCCFLISRIKELPQWKTPISIH